MLNKIQSQHKSRAGQEAPATDGDTYGANLSYGADASKGYGYGSYGNSMQPAEDSKELE